MIFPNVTLKDWLKIYPVLEVRRQKCSYCSSVQLTNIPFLEKDWAGLQSEDCACGKSKSISVSTIRKSSPSYILIDSWLSSFENTK